MATMENKGAAKGNIKQGDVKPTYIPPGYKKTVGGGNAEDKHQVEFDSGLDNGGERGMQSV